MGMDNAVELKHTLPFTIGASTMARGYKRVSLRQQVSVFVWPSNDAPDPDTGLGYFYLAALWDDLVERKHRGRVEWESTGSSVDGTKRPMRSDCISSILDHLYGRWRDLEWESEEVEPLDHNLFLYSSRQEWFEREVLGH
jgi:hypothetical protein